MREDVAIMLAEIEQLNNRIPIAPKESLRDYRETVELLLYLITFFGSHPKKVTNLPAGRQGKVTAE